ncbi:MAG: transposase [Gemmataceae bacterium]
MAWTGPPGHGERRSCPEGNHRHKNGLGRALTEVARKYQKRMQKYRDKLFVFLDHDGVPWNNNNAENAIKRFAARRRLLGATSTERGLRDYLAFLSIYQTCRHKNLTFLGFLRSGGLDLDAFAEAGRR